MKIKRAFAAILAALTLSAAAVSLTACGGNGDAGSAASTAASAVESAVSSAASVASSEASSVFNSASSAITSSASSATSSATSSAGTTAAGGIYANPSEFINAAESQQQIKQAQQTLSAQGLDMNFLAEGNNVVVVYKYQTQQTVTDAMKNSMGSYIDQQAPTMKKSLETGIQSKPGLIFRIVNADGSTVLEKSY